ncbi:zinc-ribbon domain-containing protein [Azospirillum largimobile]
MGKRKKSKATRILQGGRHYRPDEEIFKTVPSGRGNPRYSIDDMCRLAARRGGECLSPRYINSATKLRWRCADGHQWVARPASILRGSWCPDCVNRPDRPHGPGRGGRPRKHPPKPPGPWAGTGRTRPKTIEEMRELARSRGGECLSEEIVNTRQPLLWRCHLGHEWQANPMNILQGCWCQICSGSLGERLCRNVLERLFGAQFPKRRPIWLKVGRRARLELDGYCEALGIAFEYQGNQHYAQCHFFAGHDLSRVQENDARKRQRCADRGVGLIIVDEFDNLRQAGAVVDAVLKAVEAAGVALPEGCPLSDLTSLADLFMADIDRLEELARERGGEFVGLAQSGRPSTRFTWKCSSGHQWNMTGDAVRKGSWCPICTGRRRSIEHYRDIARARGGDCLSETVAHNEGPLLWRCADGHTWTATGAAVAISQNWCPVCARDKRRRWRIEDARAHAEAHGGACLTESFNNQNDQLRFRCVEGHEWSRSVRHTLLRGAWCQECERAAGKRTPSPFTLDVMKEMAAANGGECLAEGPGKSSLKVGWRCRDGHEWQTTPQCVRSGHWCPECARKRIKANSWKTKPRQGATVVKTGRMAPGRVAAPAPSGGSAP